MPECFFKHLGGCEGRLVKAHLIPKQRIKREVRIENSCGHVPSSCPFGAACADCGINELNAIVWDPRVWTWMCGGLTGIGGHHGQFDAVQIEIERDDLPEGLEEYAREYGLEWSLEADYGLPKDFHGADRS